MTAQRSHGDGRRMTVAEAVERRARMIRFHGSLADARGHGAEVRDARSMHGAYVAPDGRSWAGWNCVVCLAETIAPADVRMLEAGTLDEDSNVPATSEVLACCPACRGAA